MVSNPLKCKNTYVHCTIYMSTRVPTYLTKYCIYLIFDIIPLLTIIFTVIITIESLINQKLFI